MPTHLGVFLGGALVFLGGALVVLGEALVVLGGAIVNVTNVLADTHGRVDIYVFVHAREVHSFSESE